MARVLRTNSCPVRPERSAAGAKSKGVLYVRHDLKQSFDFGAARLRSGRAVINEFVLDVRA
jgi:hypothetical protein